MVPCQASLGVGGLPLLGQEGHGLVGGTDPLARNLLMQRHPLRERQTDRQRRSDGSGVGIEEDVQNTE